MLKPYFRQRVCDIDKGKTKRDSNKVEKPAEQNKILILSSSAYLVVHNSSETHDAHMNIIFFTHQTGVLQSSATGQSIRPEIAIKR